MGNLQMLDINVRFDFGTDYVNMFVKQFTRKIFNWDILHCWISKCVSIHLFLSTLS